MSRKSLHMKNRCTQKGGPIIGLKESMFCLPEEMQAFILSKLDGNTAAVAKRVCKLWNELLTGLETGLHFWLRCCLREIPTTTLVELTKLTTLSRGKEATLRELAKNWTDSLGCKLPWMFWREVYAEYYRCGYIEDEFQKKTELYFFPPYGEVSCLHIQDGVIYSGHRSGNIMSWQNIEDGVTCDLVYKHERRVTGIAGIDMATNTDALLNGTGNNVLVSSSIDTTLKVHNIDTEETKTLRVYSKQVNCVRSWGCDFVAGACGSMLQGQPVWHVSGSDNKLSVDVLHELFSQSAADITAVAIWNNSVISGDEIGNIFHWCGHLEQCNKPSQDDMCHIADLSSSVKSLFLHGKRIVCFTADSFLHICKDLEDHHFVSYDIYDAVKKSPECISLRASILAIGFQSGFVYMYHVPNEESWKNLDLSNPASIVTTQQEHVNAVAIGDDGGGPLVVVATEGSYLTVVQWRRKQEEDSNVKTDINGLEMKIGENCFESVTGLKIRVCENSTIVNQSNDAETNNPLKDEANYCSKTDENNDLTTKKSCLSEVVKINDMETGESNEVHFDGDSAKSTGKTESAAKIPGLLVLKTDQLDNFESWKNGSPFAHVNKSHDIS